MAEKNAIDRDFHVVVQDGGSFVEGYDIEGTATASCEDRNKRAAEMGVKTRYAVVPKP